MQNYYVDDVIARMNHAKELIASKMNAKSKELAQGIEFITNDEEMLASINLVNNYQDKKNYSAILIDEEKKIIADKMLEHVKMALNSDIELYDLNEELMVYVKRIGGKYVQSFVSYEDGQKHFLSKYEDVRTYQNGVFEDSMAVSFLHVNYYTQPELKAGPLITYHFVNNTLLLKSHQSVFDTDLDKTLAHIEMTYEFTPYYFDELSTLTGMHIYLSNDPKFSFNAYRLFEKNTIVKDMLFDQIHNYVVALSIATKKGDIFLILDYDKTLLNKALTSTQLQIGLFFLVILFVSLLFLRFMLKRGLLRPLQSLMEQIKQIRDGDYTPQRDPAHFRRT